MPKEILTADERGETQINTNKIRVSPRSSAAKKIDFSPGITFNSLPILYLFD